MGFFDRFKSKFEQFKKKSLATGATTKEKEAVADTSPLVGPMVTTKENDGSSGRVLLYPYVTEKTADLAHDGKYVFVVAPEATKVTVKQAVRSLYGTMPIDVRMISMQGKAVRFGRILGRRKDWKKAIVTMPSGKTLPIYE